MRVTHNIKVAAQINPNSELNFIKTPNFVCTQSRQTASRYKPIDGICSSAGDIETPIMDNPFHIALDKIKVIFKIENGLYLFNVFQLGLNYIDL